MTRRLMTWAPAGVLALGIVMVRGIGEQRAVPLRQPLAAVIPQRLSGLSGRDITISEDEQAVAGMSAYIMRSYTGAAGSPSFSLYVGYYDRQLQGKTIHSPRNCLPGAGWEALSSATLAIPMAEGVAVVNRYLIQHGNDRALVLYWYQGRGRVAANEYAVKWDLLRDAALRGRTEEALVRVLVPLHGTESEAERLASDVARTIIPALSRALPTS